MSIRFAKFEGSLIPVAQVGFRARLGGRGAPGLMSLL